MLTERDRPAALHGIAPHPGSGSRGRKPSHDDRCAKDLSGIGVRHDVGDRKLPAENAEAARAIAEQRPLSANILPVRGTSVKRLALVDLSIAPEKEYLEEKILVARNLTVLLPN